MLPARLGAQQGNTKKEWLSNSQLLEIYSHKQDAYTIDPLSRRLLGIRKTDDKKVNGNMVGIRTIQKKTKRKQRLSLGLGATKPIDHNRARMVSRLAEIKAEVMCCMSTTADTLNHQDPLFQGNGSQLTANEPHPYLPGFY